MVEEGVGELEELILYIPGLESQFYKKKELQETITKLSQSVSNAASTVNYIVEERKLYLSSVEFGKMEFQFILFDFVHNKITFKRQMDTPGDINRGLFELFSSLQLDFQPNKMSFIMERPAKQNYDK